MTEKKKKMGVLILGLILTSGGILGCLYPGATSIMERSILILFGMLISMSCSSVLYVTIRILLHVLRTGDIFLYRFWELLKEQTFTTVVCSIAILAIITGIANFAISVLRLMM